MGLGRINADAISAQIIREFMIRDDTGTVGEVSGWANCTTDEASHRLHQVLEPAGLVAKVGTKPQPDPLNDANLWGLTSEGFDWGMEHLEELYEKLLDERPGALVVELVNRTETVEERMDTIRGQFQSLADDVDELREQDPADDLDDRLGRMEAEVSEHAQQLDRMETMLTQLADDVDKLASRDPY